MSGIVRILDDFFLLFGKMLFSLQIFKMSRKTQRKQVGSTRVDEKFKNRQFYCGLIKAGATRKEVNEHYKRKKS